MITAASRPAPRTPWLPPKDWGLAQRVDDDLMPRQPPFPPRWPRLAELRCPFFQLPPSHSSGRMSARLRSLSRPFPSRSLVALLGRTASGFCQAVLDTQIPSSVQRQAQRAVHRAWATVLIRTSPISWRHGATCRLRPGRVSWKPFGASWSPLGTTLDSPCTIA